MPLPFHLPFIAAFCAAGMAAGAVAFSGRSLGRWIFAVGMLGLALESVLNGLSLGAGDAESAAWWQWWRLWVLAVLPGLWGLFSLCYSRGNHAEVVKRWWPWVVASMALPLLAAYGFRDELVLVIEGGEEPGVYVAGLGRMGKLLHIVALLGWVYVLLNLERTFRTAVGTMRWRIKFSVIGLALLFGTRLYATSQAYLYSVVARYQLILVACALILACLFIALSVARARVFEIDVYPSHAILYNSLTILLAGSYLLVVGALANLVAAWGGDARFPIAAALVLVAVAGFGVLCLSDRLRLRLRHFVSRHFQRPHHDYRRLWTAFSQRTATRLEQGDLAEDVVKLVSETFEALSVSIWLVDDARRTLVRGGSTVFTEGQAAGLIEELDDLGPLLAELRERTAPIEIGREKADWMPLLERLQPDQFGKGGGRVALALRANQELLGVLTVGDRVSGVSFGTQDIDLLRCLADQTAASLLNLRLSRRLIESSQMEAFRAMSTFFVHDLKNAASTLTLTLKNLEVHFDNPAFRQDLLRAIGRTSDRIKGLIERLALLRRELELRLEPGDLNDVARGALETLKGLELPVTTTFAELPRVRLDREQLQKVVTNLLLNAREALDPGGTIRLATHRQDGWAVLAVSDTGRGMTREFMARQLFRPFQTTKPKGLGIGMFHAKVIVEAHRGRIEVESAPGQGATFRLLFPIDNP